MSDDTFKLVTAGCVLLAAWSFPGTTLAMAVRCYFDRRDTREMRAGSQVSR